jgi:Bacterial Ig domain
VTQGANGSVTNNGNSVSYTPAADFHGSDSFAYTVTDGKSAADVASVSQQAQAALAYCAAHGTAPPAYFLVGDGPAVGPKQ